MEQNLSLRLFGPDQALFGYRLSGREPGGVFLHGFRSHCDGEKAVAFARHAQDRGRAWVRFDQRGCGKSPGEFAKFTISQGIEDTILVLGDFQQPTVLVGSSLGALIALNVARRYPDRVAGLLLIAPAIHFAERYFNNMQRNVLETWRTQKSFDFPDFYFGGTFALDYDFYEDAQQYVDLGNLSFSCPVAIVHGNHDELLPAQDSLEFAKRIKAPKIRTDIIPNGDHRLNSGIPLMCRRLDQLWAEAAN